MKNKNPFPLRIDYVLIEKLKYIAQDNSRSMNKEIEHIIKKHIEIYEKEFGLIEVKQNKSVRNN